MKQREREGPGQDSQVTKEDIIKALEELHGESLTKSIVTFANKKAEINKTIK